MHHELFEEMQWLIAMDPDEITDEQEDRLAALLDLHDSGQAYFEDDHNDPTLTPEGQVAEEILAAAESV